MTDPAARHARPDPEPEQVPITVLEGVGAALTALRNAQALDADDPKALIMRATVYARLAQVVALHELAAAFREIGYAVAHAIANIPTLHRDGRGEGRG
jgi:hypothetical protein